MDFSTMRIDFSTMLIDFSSMRMDVLTMLMDISSIIMDVLTMLMDFSTINCYFYLKLITWQSEQGHCLPYTKAWAAI